MNMPITGDEPRNAYRVVKARLESYEKELDEIAVNVPLWKNELKELQSKK